MNQPDVHQIGVRDVEFGARVKIVEPCNLYGCKIGDDCFVGPFTEIQKGVSVGARTRVQSHAFICELVTIGEDCFVGHGVMFINDTFSTGGPSRRTQGTVARDRDRQSGLDRLQRHDHAGAYRRQRRHRGGFRRDQGYYGCRHLCWQPARRLAEQELDYINCQSGRRSMPVPFADLQLQYQTIKGEIDGAIAAVIRDNAFIRGPYVDAFERNLLTPWTSSIAYPAPTAPMRSISRWPR